MNIGVMCLTFNRPLLLGRTIHCFLQQTHPTCRLLVLDDGGQCAHCLGTHRGILSAQRGQEISGWLQPGLQSESAWQLVSVPTRYPTLGDKRNACIQLLTDWWPEVEAIAVMDDDDVYWPCHLAAVDDALQSAPWAQPRIIYETATPGALKRCYTYPIEFPDGTTPEKHIAYGGAMAWRRTAFRAIGGYPSMDTGEDDWLREVFYCRHGPSADTISERFPDPTYWYHREGGKHLTDLGADFWAKRGQEQIDYIGQPQIGWNGPDFYRMPVIPGVHPRPWEDPALELAKSGLYVPATGDR